MDKPEEADELIDKMVETNPENATARLQRVRYLTALFSKARGSRCQPANGAAQR